MKRTIFAATLLLILPACVAPEVEYCRSYGVEGTPEFGKCITYYHEQEALFEADRQPCLAQADEVYPPSLYDKGYHTHTAGYFDHKGRYYGGQSLYIPGNAQHNAELDRLRSRILTPCMQTRGWVSESDWRAGRLSSPIHAKTPLPWRDTPK
jgi:hypothetical protein